MFPGAFRAGIFAWSCGCLQFGVLTELMAHAVFLWHMHQPYYVNPASRTALMPWVRLHAVKGYLDMV